MEKAFFELLQIAIGNRTNLSRSLSASEWDFVYETARKQALVGIAFAGASKLPEGSRPPIDMVLNWVFEASAIQEQNHHIDWACRQLVQRFKEEGFETCILKGQTNRIYYGKELGSYRTSGDIDIWMTPTSRTEYPVREVMEYLEKKKAVVSLCYLHAELKPMDDVAIEAHFRPSFLNSPRRNQYFQQLFEKMGYCTDYDNPLQIPKLKTELDLVFQLNHLYRHLIDEGVGLRQILDYYMLLRYSAENSIEKKDVLNHIQRCGMKRFTGAVMWVLETVFAMPREWMICEPVEKDGQFLLNEIMLAGNFGHYDPRLQQIEVQKGKRSFQLAKAARRFRRNFRFILTYPEEVIFEPYARIKHTFWRDFKLWRFE